MPKAPKAPKAPKDCELRKEKPGKKHKLKLRDDMTDEDALAYLRKSIARERAQADRRTEEFLRKMENDKDIGATVREYKRLPPLEIKSSKDKKDKNCKKPEK